MCDTSQRYCLKTPFLMPNLSHRCITKTRILHSIYRPNLFIFRQHSMALTAHPHVNRPSEYPVYPVNPTEELRPKTCYLFSSRFGSPRASSRHTGLGGAPPDTSLPSPRRCRVSRPPARSSGAFWRSSGGGGSPARRCSGSH